MYVEPHPHRCAAPDHPNSYLHLQSYLVPTGTLHKGNTPSLLQLATIMLTGGSQHIYGTELSLMIGLGVYY